MLFFLQLDFDMFVLCNNLFVKKYSLYGFIFFSYFTMIIKEKVDKKFVYGCSRESAQFSRESERQTDHPMRNFQRLLGLYCQQT